MNDASIRENNNGNVVNQLDPKEVDLLLNSVPLVKSYLSRRLEYLEKFVGAIDQNQEQEVLELASWYEEFDRKMINTILYGMAYQDGDLLLESISKSNPYDVLFYFYPLISYIHENKLDIVANEKENVDKRKYEDIMSDSHVGILKEINVIKMILNGSFSIVENASDYSIYDRSIYALLWFFHINLFGENNENEREFLGYTVNASPSEDSKKWVFEKKSDLSLNGDGKKKPFVSSSATRSSPSGATVADHRRRAGEVLDGVKKQTLKQFKDIDEETVDEIIVDESSYNELESANRSEFARKYVVTKLGDGTVRIYRKAIAASSGSAEIESASVDAKETKRREILYKKSLSASAMFVSRKDLEYLKQKYGDKFGEIFDYSFESSSDGSVVLKIIRNAQGSSEINSSPQYNAAYSRRRDKFKALFSKNKSLENIDEKRNVTSLVGDSEDALQKLNRLRDEGVFREIDINEINRFKTVIKSDKFDKLFDLVTTDESGEPLKDAQGRQIYQVIVRKLGVKKADFDELIESTESMRNEHFTASSNLFYEYLGKKRLSSEEIDQVNQFLKYLVSRTSEVFNINNYGNLPESLKNAINKLSESGVYKRLYDFAIVQSAAAFDKSTQDPAESKNGIRYVAFAEQLRTVFNSSRMLLFGEEIGDIEAYGVEKNVAANSARLAEKLKSLTPSAMGWLRNPQFLTENPSSLNDLIQGESP